MFNKNIIKLCRLGVHIVSHVIKSHIITADRTDSSVFIVAVWSGNLPSSILVLVPVNFGLGIGLTLNILLLL